MTHFDEFSDFVRGLNKNAKEKIKNAHIQKARSIIAYFKDSIHQILREKYEPLLQDLQENLESTTNKLDYIQEQFIKKCKANTNDIIDKNISKIKRETYNDIESDIDDSYFKYKLEENITNTIENHLKPQLEQVLKERQQELDKYIQEELEKYKNRMQECIDYISHLSVKDNFGNNLDIKIDSGIEFGGLAMGVIGAGLGVWSGIVALGAANVWNPVGWTIIVASVLCGLLAAAKSVFKFFSSSYKQSEQKKATDSALYDIKNAIEKDIGEQIDSNQQIMNENIEELKEVLSQPVQNIENSINLLKQINDELEELDSSIEALL